MKIIILLTLGLALLPLKTTALEYLIGTVDYPVARDLEVKIAQAYRAIGHTTKFVQFPMARRLILLNAGVIDADLVARSNLSDTFPAIIQVGPPLLPFDLYLVCPQKTACTEQRFQDPSVTIYSSIGSKAVIDEDQRVLSPEGLATYVDSPRQLKKLFEQHRINYFVHAAINQKMEDAHLQRPYEYHFLGSYNLYHHIHKSHSDIASSLSKELNRQFSTQ